ncbi:MAG: hypothetical protein ACI9JN_002774 [Bacteroidia bacterium]|jgi:hypothetical protein
MKRVFGYFLRILSILFTLSIVLRLQIYFQIIKRFGQALGGSLDAYETGYAITQFLIGLALIGIIILLWNTGGKMIRSKKKL